MYKLFYRSFLGFDYPLLEYGAIKSRDDALKLAVDLNNKRETGFSVDLVDGTKDYCGYYVLEPNGNRVMFAKIRKGE